MKQIACKNGCGPYWIGLLFITAFAATTGWIAFAEFVSNATLDDLLGLQVSLLKSGLRDWLWIVEYRVRQGRDPLRYEIYCYYALAFYAVAFTSVCAGCSLIGEEALFDDEVAAERRLSAKLRRRRLIGFAIFLTIFLLSPFYLTRAFLFNDEASDVVTLAMADTAKCWVQAMLLGCIFSMIRK